MICRRCGKESSPITFGYCLPCSESLGARPKITLNAVYCLKCDVLIESTHHYDFVSCKCGAVAVDGGQDYLRRLYKDKKDYVELSE